jgi:hypothetical protein
MRSSVLHISRGRFLIAAKHYVTTTTMTVNEKEQPSVWQPSTLEMTEKRSSANQSFQGEEAEEEDDRDHRLERAERQMREYAQNIENGRGDRRGKQTVRINE